jgi:hypothetical protein
MKIEMLNERMTADAVSNNTNPRPIYHANRPKIQAGSAV